MITVFGKELVSGYTNGVSVKEIYNKGWLVWRAGVYYISWLPSDASGSFILGGSTYNLQDYSGYFSGFNGTISSSAFKNNSTISYIETNAFDVEEYAFTRCSSLTGVSMSECYNVGRHAFEACRSLSYVDLPECINIQEYAFNECAALISVSFSKCQYIGNRTFRNCTSLNYVNLPSCSRINQFTFYGCSSLETVNLPTCSSVGLEAFYGCHNLSDIGLQNCEYVGLMTFGFCYLLSEISLPRCNKIAPGAFTGCSVLKRVTINASSVCEMQSDTLFGYPLAFYNTPIDNGSGYIYVPYSLVDSYKTAPNWSVYKNQILPIQ